MRSFLMITLSPQGNKGLLCSYSKSSIFYFSARLLKRLDFSEMKFSLYFLGYEVKICSVFTKLEWILLTETKYRTLQFAS